MSIPSVEWLLEHGLKIEEPSEAINRAVYSSLHVPLENLLRIVTSQVTPKAKAAAEP